MPLFDTKNITKQHLQELIDNKIFENKELEYKDYSLVGGKMTDKHKDKFVKEIAAFANTNGGTIIVGMQEDENRLPIKLSGAGFSIKEFDNWLSSFRQLILSRIRPHLHGVECIPIEVDNSNIAIVISVPKSYARPHSFGTETKTSFLYVMLMELHIWTLMICGKSFYTQIVCKIKFANSGKNRISMILANECIGDLGNDTKIVFHIVPEWSFELGNRINLEKLSNDRSFRPIAGSGWNYRYNADGYCIYA